MKLPEDLQAALEQMLGTCRSNELKAAREHLSADYREGRNSAQGFRDKTQLMSYLATRMPATFGACAAVFQALRDRYPLFSCRSFLDLGAGPGTASWAARDVFPELAELHLVEREATAIEIGKSLSASWQNGTWRQAGLESAFDVPRVDLATLSYAYGELSVNIGHALLERLWNQKVPLVAVIEPGTPKGFARIRELRTWVIEKGARIVAPCPHEAACPMLPNDWCHFSSRIERTRLHRQLKEGSLGYEDEKYSYVVYAHPEAKIGLTPIRGRILRHPHKGSGFVKFPICAEEGVIREVTITRSNKTEYRKARDAEWGDMF